MLLFTLYTIDILLELVRLILQNVMLECQYQHTSGGINDRQIEPFMIAATKLSAKLTYKRTHDFPRGSL